ncbi:hypothetical protein Lfu02_17700 [Longispora fulva]|uniref:Uncharacterized protein n=1 Tax=Longispora fulva TaxID=619741 RepID=A0A8J7GVD8_9ACTN|nr:hypothetical protein [Longispora fulva]MBG6140225.1 hypothetical protein [Longispora fulva]GIG57398.1 hypothetical protein Lfu02_17700 [Longispora fulva]
MNRISLPDGAWADLRDPQAVPERLRRPIVRMQTKLAGKQAVMSAIQSTSADALDDPAESERVAASLGDALDLIDELNDLVVVALVGGWSYQSAISVDALLDMPSAAYASLRKACAPHLKDMTPDFSPDGADDAASPIAPSNA